ncbi:hypothetical protein [Saccharothrix texasensis]|uniref:Uncharacterized protein n=1 Tax=Saccharothrix texasensis TaxID=103734 RepID=A0A3N1GYH1_9PSEU|nr:hypothetical protein [Saccharothrix texasensis]ROP35371.1 hypothetical protein EDD40_0597 [Saccharothrix texasensis]
MIIAFTPANSGSFSCLPLPAVFVRAVVLVVVYVFVLVLLRWGYDTNITLMLVSVLSLVAVRTGHSLLSPPRTKPSISLSR